MAAGIDAFVRAQGDHRRVIRTPELDFHEADSQNATVEPLPMPGSEHSR